MLDNLPLQKVLFLDIETVPQCPSYDHLDDEWKDLWAAKSRFFREKDNVELADSYHRAGIYAEFGKIVCISVAYFMDDKKLRTQSFFGKDEVKVLQSFLDFVIKSNFKLLCAHNGKEFDFPFMARRILIKRLPLPELLDMAGKKPWELAHLDTMELWKFGDYKHYTSLSLLCKAFGIDTPKSDLDGSRVAEVYWKQQDLARIARYCEQDVRAVVALLSLYRQQAISPVG